MRHEGLAFAYYICGDRKTKTKTDRADTGRAGADRADTDRADTDVLHAVACCWVCLRAAAGCCVLCAVCCCYLCAAAAFVLLLVLLCAAACRCPGFRAAPASLRAAAGCCGLRTACCELLRAAILRAVSCYKVLAMPSVQPLAARSRLVPAIWKAWFGRDSNTRLIQIPRRFRRPWDCHQDMSHGTKYKMLKPPARNLTSYLRFSVASCQKLKNMVGTPRQCYFCEN